MAGNPSLYGERIFEKKKRNIFEVKLCFFSSTKSPNTSLVSKMPGVTGLDFLFLLL